MKNLYKPFSFPIISTMLLVACLGRPLASQAQYTPGNLVVLRVGDGLSTQNGASTAVFLDEYTPAGVLVSSTPINATGTANKLTNSGTSTAEGMMTLSANGQYLLTTGYNAEPGVAGITTSASATIPRTVARIGSNRIPDISTVLPNAFTGGNIRSAASTDGSSFFLTGSTGGVRYATLGATTSSVTSTTSTNTRVIHIYRNQVYFSTGSGTSPGIYVVGAATNSATGQTATSFINTGVATMSNGFVGSPYGFVLLDRDPNILGIDAAYIADDGIGGSAGGIQKWSFDGNSWTKQGSIGAAYRGLTGTLNSDGNVTLYATTPTSFGGNQLVVVTDTNPYNAPPSTTAVTVRVTAAPNQAMRGVDFAPGTIVALPVELTSFGATRTTAGSQLRWTTASEVNSHHFEVERSANGITFTKVLAVTAAGTTAQAHSYAILDRNAPAGLHYYRLHQVDADGASAYSAVVAVATGLATEFIISPNPASESINLHTDAATPYSVRSALGAEVQHGTTAAGTTSLAVAGLPAGIYFLELSTDLGRVVRKFIKN